MKYLANEPYLHKKKTKDINIQETFHLIKKRIWIIFVFAVLAVLLGIFYNNSQEFIPEYEASTRIIIASSGENMSTLMVMITDPIIMDGVKEKLGLTRSTEALAKQIAVSRIEDSSVILISVLDKDPELAAKIADTTAETYKTEIANLLQFRGVQLLSKAKVSDTPINEKPQRSLVIFLVGGIVLGIGAVFLVDALDSKVRKEYEVEDALGAPVLGVVSNMNSKKARIKSKKRHKSVEIRGENIGAEKP
jgi:capsular polysaccharide biosynthesis protein